MNIPDEVLAELKLYLAARAKQDDSYAYRLLALLERLPEDSPGGNMMSLAVPPYDEEVLDC
ncbi:hypothetical protein [Spirulina subsalsa]|uniref:hypothetical protein n=1 Tax=Spirulina subsalsa TaxID=54311 RepID=UPI00030F9CB4|nr:hypothetical protein [Spirulina subsalsa]